MKLQRTISKFLNLHSKEKFFFKIEINVPLESELGDWFRDNDSFTAEVSNGVITLKN